MNGFSAIILVALAGKLALDLTANWLNLRALQLEPPSALQGIFGEKEYRNSQEYTRTTTRFGLLVDAVELAVLLAFWFAGGFSHLDNVVRDWGMPIIVTGLFYIGIIALAHSLIALPFNIYATFVIEERFGFNRTTPRVFVLDHVKAFILALLLGTPVLAVVLALFQHGGSNAWVYCWMAVTAFLLFIQFIAPNWIMPLFNKFTPMESGELKDAIFKYARSVDFSIDNVYVMDGSNRSTKSNAFFTGFGRNKRIALFDTLIEKHTTGEMVNILAHEIGHYKKKHILQGIVISVLHAGLLFYLLSIFLDSSSLYNAFYMDHQSVYAGLLFFGLLYTPIELVISIVLQVLSRSNEYEADRFAVETLRDPHGMIDALKKLYATNLSNLTPHPFYVFINYSHPPLLQRMAAIQKAGTSTARSSHLTTH